MCVRVHARVRARMRACIVRTYVPTYACMPFFLAYLSLTLLGWLTSSFIWGPTWNLKGFFFFFFFFFVWYGMITYVKTMS